MGFQGLRGNALGSHVDLDFPFPTEYLGPRSHNEDYGTFQEFRIMSLFVISTNCLVCDAIKLKFTETCTCVYLNVADVYLSYLHISFLKKY